jgi:hypothetical protein
MIIPNLPALVVALGIRQSTTGIATIQHRFFYTVLFPLKKNLDDAIAFCDFVIDGNGCQPMDKQRG